MHGYTKYILLKCCFNIFVSMLIFIPNVRIMLTHGYWMEQHINRPTTTFMWIAIWTTSTINLVNCSFMLVVYIYHCWLHFVPFSFNRSTIHPRILCWQYIDELGSMFWFPLQVICSYFRMSPCTHFSDFVMRVLSILLGDSIYSW